jgi:hypothetical protein
MSNSDTAPVIVLLLSLGIIILALCGIITWTIRISFRLSKVDAPRLRFLFAIAFLQILLGGLTVYMTLFILKPIKDVLIIVFGTSAGIIILSGLFLIKLILKNGWRRSLRIWAIAAAMQLVLVPICSVTMWGGWVMLFLWLYPPLL